MRRLSEAQVISVAVKDFARATDKKTFFLYREVERANMVEAAKDILNRDSDMIALRLPNPQTESQWYKGVLPWFRDLEPGARGKALLIAAAWEPVGHWDKTWWMAWGTRRLVDGHSVGLSTHLHGFDPAILALRAVALDVPLQMVGAFALTNVYARDKLIRLITNVRQVRLENQTALVDEIYENMLPRPEQARPAKLSKEPPVFGFDGW